MKTHDAFKDRERALEDEFFYRIDKELIAKLRAELAADSEQIQLSKTIGCDDPALLQELISLGVSTEAIAAVSLIPLVLVAWSDGRVELKQRDSILAAARSQSIDGESPAAKLLETWLNNKPGPELASVWKHYVQEMSKHMTEEKQQALRSHVLKRAMEVARASGGVLGIGAVSADERRVIAEIEEAFER